MENHALGFLESNGDTSVLRTLLNQNFPQSGCGPTKEKAAFHHAWWFRLHTSSATVMKKGGSG